MLQAVAVTNTFMSYYDDCAGDPTCPATDDQIAFFVGIGIIAFVAFWVLAFAFYGADKGKQAIRKSRWDGKVHSRGAACGAKTIDRSYGPDTTSNANDVTCTACKTALKSAGWDGLVHGEALGTSYRSLCGLEKQSYRSGVWVPTHIDHFVKVFDIKYGNYTTDQSHNRRQVSCPKCLELLAEEEAK
jgi:ribosomal protein S27E